MFADDLNNAYAHEIKPRTNHPWEIHTISNEVVLAVSLIYQHKDVLVSPTVRDYEYSGVLVHECTSTPDQKGTCGHEYLCILVHGCTNISVFSTLKIVLQAILMEQLQYGIQLED